MFFRHKNDTHEKACIEDPKHEETRVAIQYYERRFKILVVISVIYGLFFINYIDIITYAKPIYHLWLFVMYFFPFIILTVLYPRNWALTLGLGLIASLMNDVFYGLLRVLSGIGLPYSLPHYYYLWFIPSDEFLFDADIGFAVLPIYSWVMSISIYARIAAVVALFWIWRSQAKRRCLNEAQKTASPH